MTEHVARNHAQFNRIKINCTFRLRLNTRYAITTEMQFLNLRSEGMAGNFL